MKALLLALLPLWSFASSLPLQPPTPCHRGCTPAMERIWQDFQSHPHAPRLSPGVYSGDCFHSSRDYDPLHAHRGMVLLDRHPSENRFYFAAGFAFFGPPTEYSDWSLERGRKESYGAWNHYSPISIEENTMRVHVATQEGAPAWIYYLRQNPENGHLFYITYWGFSQVSFCELAPNEPWR